MMIIIIITETMRIIYVRVNEGNTEKGIIKIIVRLMKTAMNYSRNDDHNEDIDVHDKQEDVCNKNIMLKIVMINHK